MQTLRPPSESGPAADCLEQYRNFIVDEIEADLAQQRYQRPICTRFPPEPNGYLHIGHAMAIVLNHSIAKKFNGIFHVRFDDTNPLKEKQEYVDADLEDLQWLQIKVSGQIRFVSDYFDKLCDYAVRLIENGAAYVCDLSLEEMKKYRGDYHTPGQPSPYRERPMAENLDLFTRMRAGEFAPGARTLRAKIEVNSSNMNMRDPILYRIVAGEHYRQGGAWKIYPSYDFAQGYSDAIDGVTHSLCSKEFENHRPLYDWLLQAVNEPEPPRQIEFGKMAIAGAVLGKRHIMRLIGEGVLSGWDDPRVFTIRGMRRRGFPPQAINDFCLGAAVSRVDSKKVQFSALEVVVRDHLNRSAPRRLAVSDPIKLELENLEQAIEIELPNHPDNPAAGSRKVAFSRHLYISADDFMLNPPPKFWRLSPGAEVRLRGAYVIQCTGYEIDPQSGQVTLLRARCDLDTLGNNPADGRKVKGVIHWVAADSARPAELRLYSDLVDENWEIQNDSLQIKTAMVEAALAEAQAGDCFQFERVGYFCADPASCPEQLIFNRTVTLRDNKMRKALD